MKNIFRLFSKYFFLILILAGCGTADSISNSAGPSTPSGIVLNLEASPSSVDSGGSTIITVKATFNSTGASASGETVTASVGSGGSLDEDSKVTNSNGRALFTATVTTPVTVSFTLEDITASIRINVNE